MTIKTIGVAMGAAALAFAPIAAAETFHVTSTDLSEGGVIAAVHGGSQNGCTGGNVSPQIAWRGAPETTKSFALVVQDPDGARGLGVVHWMVYGVPAEVTALARGAGAQPGAGFVAGRNSRNLLAYLGPCPPVGDAPHHYVFGVYALDLAPGALPAELDKAAFFEAIKGHVLAETSLVARFSRP